MAKYKCIFKYDWNSNPKVVATKDTKEEAITFLSQKYCNSDEARQALDERGYYTISYGPNEISIEEEVMA